MCWDCGDKREADGRACKCDKVGMIEMEGQMCGVELLPRERRREK